MVFDARKHAERSKRAREASAGTPQLSKSESYVSDPKDIATTEKESSLALNPSRQTPKMHSSRLDLTGATRIARPYAKSVRAIEITESNVVHQAPLVRSLLRVSRSEHFSGTPHASNLTQQCGNFEPATLISPRNPIYPAAAREQLISGNVEVHFRISPEGKVYDARSVKGPPVLAPAAIEAVEAWSYEPARLNGIPIDSQASTNFDFKLN